MRIDLGLQCTEFSAPQIVRRLLLAVHEKPDFLCHVIVGVGQHADLVTASVPDVQGLGASGAHLLHLQGNGYDTVRYGAGQLKGDVHGNRCKEQVNQRKMCHHVPARVRDMEGWNDGNHNPVRVLDGKIGRIGGTVHK